MSMSAQFWKKGRLAEGRPVLMNVGHVTCHMSHAGVTARLQRTGHGELRS